MKRPIIDEAATGTPNSITNLKNKSILLFMPKKRGLYDPFININFSKKTTFSKAPIKYLE